MSRRGARRICSPLAIVALVATPVVLALAVLLCGAAALAQGQAPDAVARGKAVYAKRCVFCHGREGKGDGEVADYLNPRPRDFASGVYKLRTTQSGEAPVDEDLVRILAKGIPGTAMQGFADVLSEDERRHVIAYLKTFAPDRFKAAPERAPVGSDKSGAADKGKEVYDKAKCWECHGRAGRGNGEKADQLTDDWGSPILPANLTKGWQYKGGSSVKDIFTRFTTGMDGTPMPSYADVLSEDERWNLAAFVRTFVKEERAGADPIVRARRVSQEVPLDPDHPLWREAEPVEVPMSGQVIVAPRWQNPSVDQLVVRALYTDAAVGFLVEWDDRVKDTVHHEEPLPSETDTYARVIPNKKWTLRDAVAIQFPAGYAEGQERPYLLLGQSGKPVVLWHWKADWNEDKNRRTPVEVLRAAGSKKPAAPLADESQVVKGKGVFRDGRWKVVMIRVLQAPGKGKDVGFTAGQVIPIAFHAWDGSNGEQKLLMSLSSWFSLVLEPRTPPSVFAYAFLTILGGFAVEGLLIRRIRLRPAVPRAGPVAAPAALRGSSDAHHEEDA